MSSSLTANMESILDRFDDAWNGPTPPRIEDYLAEADTDRRLTLLIELVRIDLERRLAAGEKLRLEETYLRRFPELSAEPPAIVTLVKHEFAVRRRNEPGLMPAEYLARFPQCQTELVAQLPTLDEIRNGEQQPKTADASAGLDLRGYQLIETLGKGGMGEVYRCVDPALGRDLAIKVMKAECRGHAVAAGRFLREARVTGSLQHPGIVPIHNLGRLSDGRLHYTMRLVRGQTFADILKDEAGKPERLPYLLSIFEKICQAVAYAHSKRVIHRDLKPQNVMVGKFGEVQVMDWGLAKVLTLGDAPTEPEEKTDATGTRIVTEADTPSDLSRTGSGMGTPAYMPPEQALGEWDTVDERADVFALGSILCAILTGEPAYSGTDGNEVYRRAKRGDMTEALQRLQQCGTDAALTALCRECLSPNREDRPRDADAVAKRVAEYQAEVQERLRQAEVERAQAQLKAREGRKQRRLLVALVVALLAGGVLSTWQAVRATAERDEKDIALGKAEAATEAERQAKESDQARLGELTKSNEVLMSIFRDLDPRTEEKGGPSLRHQLSHHLERAAKQLDEAAVGDAVTVARLQATLGNSLISLGQAKQAIKLLNKARMTFEDKLGADHPDTLNSCNSLASAYQSSGRTAEAIRLHEQTLKHQEAKLGPDHPETLTSRNNLAEAYRSAGRIAEAIRLHEQNLKQREASLGADDPNTLTCRNNLAGAYWSAGRRTDAIRLHDQTLKQMETKLGPDHPFTLASRNNLAEAYRSAGRIAEAISLHEKNLKLWEAKLGAEHPSTLRAMHNLGSSYRDAGRAADAIRLHEQCLKLREAKFGLVHPDTLASRNELANCYESAGRTAEAISMQEITLKQRELQLGPDHPGTLTSRNNLAVMYQSAGRTSDAIHLHEQNFKLRETKLGPEHPDTLQSRNNLAGAYWFAGKLDHSVPLFEQALKLYKVQFGPDHPSTLLSMANLGVNYRDVGRLQDAIPLLEEALQRARNRSGGFPVQLAWVPFALAATYERAGQFTKAEGIYHDLLEQTRQKFDSDDPRTAGQMALLGSNLLHQHKYTDAEPFLRDCLKVRQAKQPEDWVTFNSRSLLGAALLGQKKYADAEPLLLQGYEGMKARAAKIPPQGKVRLTEALERLVQLYEATEQKDKAAEWRKKLQETKAAQKKPKP